jgi:hypothetical protein
VSLMSAIIVYKWLLQSTSSHFSDTASGPIAYNSAVVVGTDTLGGTNSGAAYTVVSRYTVTYIRRHGQWLALSEHLVEVPQAKWPYEVGAAASNSKTEMPGERV